MSKLSTLVRKSKTCKIGEIELEVKSLEFEDIGLLAELENPETRINAMKKIITIAIKKGISDATDEEISKIPVKDLIGLTKAIEEVNGLEHVKTKKD